MLISIGHLSSWVGTILVQLKLIGGFITFYFSFVVFMYACIVSKQTSCGSIVTASKPLPPRATTTIHAGRAIGSSSGALFCFAALGSASGYIAWAAPEGAHSASTSILVVDDPKTASTRSSTTVAFLLNIDVTPGGFGNGGVQEKSAKRSLITGGDPPSPCPLLSFALCTVANPSTGALPGIVLTTTPSFCRALSAYTHQLGRGCPSQDSNPLRLAWASEQEFPQPPSSGQHDLLAMDRLARTAFVMNDPGSGAAAGRTGGVIGHALLHCSASRCAPFLYHC
eukprot:SAG31_NODE_3677_length_3996_cov_5.686939_1_plen_281_part_10